MLSTGSVLKEALISTIVIDVSHDIVEDHDDEFEVPGQSLQLLRVPVHKLSSFDVVDCAILFDEILADRMDVVNDHKFYRLFVNPGGQVYEQLRVLIDTVHVLQVDSSSHIVFGHGSCLLLVLGDLSALSEEIV